MSTTYLEDSEGNSSQFFSGNIFKSLDDEFNDAELRVRELLAGGVVESHDPDVQQSVVHHLEVSEVSLQDFLEATWVRQC
jgi:hypothetical protein